MKNLNLLLCLGALAAVAGCEKSYGPAASDPSATHTTSSETMSTPATTVETTTVAAPSPAPAPQHQATTDTTPAPVAKTTEPAPNPSVATPPAPNEVGGNSRPDADNTRVNGRDHNGNGSGLTPMDQGGSEGDRKLTQKIRQAVMGDSSLSFTAKNVKIITIGGRVTLRGPVKSDLERSNIEARAKQIAGDGQVVNQLEVKK